MYFCIKNPCFNVISKIFAEEKNFILAYIQGKRKNVGAPWTDESGNPLPYLAPQMINNNNPHNNVLILVSTTVVRFTAVNEENGVDAGILCQI